MRALTRSEVRNISQLEAVISKLGEDNIREFFCAPNYPGDEGCVSLLDWTISVMEEMGGGVRKHSHCGGGGGRCLIF